MIKFLLGLGIIIVYSFLTYAINKNKDQFLSIVSLIIVLISCYYIGDLVLYKYAGSLT